MVATILVEDALTVNNAVFIDTRSPKEFAEDHIPHAVNIPILSNEERAVVGTLYKQVSQDKGLEVGMEFYRKNTPSILAAVEQHKTKTLLIYCWRGGLRSKTIAELFASLGYAVFQVQGGYKSYREYVRKRLSNYTLHSRLIVLYGLTGTGKTELLQHFSHSIDLEALAGHRGSVYGGIGLQQHSQKKFENLLLQRLEALHMQKYIIVEGESKRIGDVFIPEFFFSAMEQGIKILVQRSFDKRIAYSTATYCNTEEKTKEFLAITHNLRKNISNATKQTIITALEKKDVHTALSVLFKEYYDPLYSHYLDTLSYAFRINTDEIEEGIRQLKNFIHQYSQQFLHSVQ
jgi:tRNA 2-selenouridine synthase